MKTAAAAIALAAVATGAAVASPTGTTVTVTPSVITFKAAAAACPGALAGISFALNHLRIAELPGVDSDIDAGDPTKQTVTLAGANGAAAIVTVNAEKHTVTAKNVKLAGNNVACVSPD